MSLEKTIQDPYDIIEKTPIGIYTTTPQGRYTSANPALARMFGYESPEELIASITDIATQVYVNPEERQEFMRMIQEHGKVVEHECRFKRKDGFKFWVSINARAVRDQNGNTLYYQGFTTDITERKQVEQDKEEIKERYRRMFMNAPVPYQSLDEQGFFLDVNETFLDILGYAREEVIGKNFGDFLHSDWVEQFKENFPRFKAVGEVLGVEFEMVKKDGSSILVYLNGKIQRDEQGQFLRTDCIFHDITERKRAEDAMRKSESLFKKVFEILPIGLWIADNKGKLLRGNSAGVAIWGAQPNVDQREYGVFKARRLPSGEEISPDDWALAHTVNKGETIIDELLEIDAFDGKKKIILNYTAPVFNEEGNVEAAIVVNQDITDRKMAEEALRVSEKLLSRAQEISHTGSWKLDMTANRLTWSDEVYRIYGCEPQEFAATYEAFLDFVHPDDRAALDEAYSRSLREGSDGDEIEHRIVRRDSGEVRYVHERCVHERDDAGALIQSTGMVQDITERKKNEEQLKYLSLHDQWTGLYNRAYLENELKRLQKSREHPIAIICMDLDGLKLVNDTLGHDHGDRHLKACARILQESFRASDIVARVGGDEFTALLPGSDIKSGEKITNRIQARLESYNQEQSCYCV